MAPEKLIRGKCGQNFLLSKLSGSALYSTSGGYIYRSYCIYTLLIMDSPNSHKYSCTPTERHNHIHCTDTGWNHILNSLDHSRHPVQRRELSTSKREMEREREHTREKERGRETCRNGRVEMIGKRRVIILLQRIRIGTYIRKLWIIALVWVTFTVVITGIGTNSHCIFTKITQSRQRCSFTFTPFKCTIALATLYRIGLKLIKLTVQKVV